MPTYDYRCSRGHQFEVFQKMSDEPVAVCPECGEAAQRQISGGAGFLFKGDGFYITDYRSEDYKKKASAEKADGGGERGDTKGGGASGGGSAKEQAGASGGASSSSSGPSGSSGKETS